jgi:bifunctional NMN adenylyltransferase/nudix hydrolase
MITPDIGIIVGRFQVHELHDGHMELFRIVNSLHNRVVVFIGCTKAGPSRYNPLDFETRKRMIQAAFPEITVLPLQDKRTDEQWSRELDNRIDDVVGGTPANVTLYGARDSFVPHYHGKHKVKELTVVVPKPTSGTEVRAALTNQVMSSADFRAGQIYAAGQRFANCIPTVDIAILNTEGTHVCLGRRADDVKWRFIGGHAETGLLTYEQDACTEVMQETGLDLARLQYIGSTVIDGWRHRGTENRIKTLFFVGYSPTMAGRGADDIAETHWFPLDKLNFEFD